MKYFKSKLLKILFALQILGFPSQNLYALTSAQATIQHFHLRNCNLDSKCLVLSAEKALSSQFLPIYNLKNFSVTIIQNDRPRLIEASTGYIDFAQDMVVLTLRTGSDYTINLKNLEEKDFSK